MLFCTFYTGYDGEPIVHIGWDEDVTIRELAERVLSVIGYRGDARCGMSRAKLT